jgi:hypothetical protein
MLKDTIKVIAGALGLALYTTAIVSPPRPAAAQNVPAQSPFLTTDHFDQVIGQLSRDIGREIKDNNRDLADAIAAAIRQQPPVPVKCGEDCRVPVKCGEDCRPHHHHEPTKVVVVEKVVHVAHRLHWCCRPPPPCPPWRGWY